MTCMYILRHDIQSVGTRWSAVLLLFVFLSITGAVGGQENDDFHRVQLSSDIVRRANMNCSAHVLWMALHQLGINEEIGILKEKLGITIYRGASIQKIIDVAKEYEVDASLNMINNLDGQEGPLALLVDDDAHLVYFIAVDGQNVVLIDNLTQISSTRADLNKRWDGVALVFVRKNLSAKRNLFRGMAMLIGLAGIVFLVYGATRSVQSRTTVPSQNE